MDTDLLIVGGTESGWAAAIQAARMGVPSITLVNDITWLGGQFTAEAVGAIDENRGVDAKVPFARSGLFAELAAKIEEWNAQRYGHKSPGNAWTARTTIRPAEGEALLRSMIEPYVKRGQIQVISHYYPVGADLASDGKTLQAVHFRSTEPGQTELIVRARIIIDASDWGDVIQASGAAFAYGPDLRSAYGEPNAPADHSQYSATDLNPITYSLVIVETDREQIIPKPQHYDERRYFLTSDVTKEDYLRLPWPFPPHRPFNPPWTPLTGSFYQGDRSVYSQRRLIDRYNLKIDHPDVISLVWSVQDYPLDLLPQWVEEELEANEPGASKRNLVLMTPAQRRIVFEDAKQHSLGMLYHLQTTVHERMQDRSHSFRRFRLAEEFGTPDGMPPKPYLRESLRLKAMYMMREQDTRNFDGSPDVATAFLRSSRRGARDAFARVLYYDGVAVWQFPYDFHPTGRMFLHGDRGGPWAAYIKPLRTWGTQSDRALFPLRSLIPERVDGLLGAQKNLGYSSIVGSAVRIHDQSIAIGQAAGATAAVALRRNLPPRLFPYRLDLLGEVQMALCSRLDGGIPAMLWPFRDMDPSHPAFVASNLLAVQQSLPYEQHQVDFRPNDPATEEWKSQVIARSLARKSFPKPPGDPWTPGMTRGEFARLWWDRIRSAPDRRPRRFSALDSDNDGMPDPDDPAPFDGDNNNLMDHIENQK
jgi:hypothetical protein